MSGGPGFYRGTSYEQTPYFANKERKMIESKNWPSCFSKKVDMSKVSLEIIRPWISRQITSLLGLEDEIVIDYCMSQLRPEEALTEEQTGTLSKPYEIDPKKLQINLTGFMAKHTGKFVKELWELLLSAQENSSGIPQQFIDDKKEELKRKQEEQIKLQEEIARQQESFLAEAQKYQNSNTGKNNFTATNFQDTPVPDPPKGFSTSVEQNSENENKSDKGIHEGNGKPYDPPLKESPKISSNESQEKDKPSDKKFSKSTKRNSPRSVSSSSTSSRSRSSSYSSSNSSVRSRRSSYHRSTRDRRHRYYSRDLPARYQRRPQYHPESRNRPRQYRPRYFSPVRHSTYSQRRQRYASSSRSSSRDSSYSSRSSSPVRDSRNLKKRDGNRRDTLNKEKTRDRQTRQRDNKATDTKEPEIKSKPKEDVQEHKHDKRHSPKRRYEATDDDQNRTKRRKPEVSHHRSPRNRNSSPSSSSNSRSSSRHSRHRNRPVKHTNEQHQNKHISSRPFHKPKPAETKRNTSISPEKLKDKSVPSSPPPCSSPNHSKNLNNNLSINKKPRPTGRLRAWSTSSSNPSERENKKSGQTEEKHKDGTDHPENYQPNGNTQHRKNVNHLNSQEIPRSERTTKPYHSERSFSEEKLRQKALGLIKKREHNKPAEDQLNNK